MTNRSLFRAVLLGLVFALSAVVIARASRSEPTVLRSPLDDLPMAVADWSGVRAPDLEPKVLELLALDEYLNRIYTKPSAQAPVGLYIAYYKSQREGQALHSPLNCLPGSGWQPTRSGRVMVDAGPGRPAAEINRYVVQKAGASDLVLYWYQSHGRVIASEYWGKFFLVADAIRLNRTDAALVRVVVPIPGGEAGESAADKAGMDFVRSVLPLLVRHLPA